jgi:hypothetical protein
MRYLPPMQRIILAVFGLLLLGAAVFCRERMFFIDAPFMLHRILTEGSLQIQEQRYGSFLTQGVVWLGGALGLPFKAIVVLYSLSFNLLYLSVALLLLRWKQTSLALLLTLYFLLFATATYYWTNNEVHQGVAWLFLYLGLAGYGESRGLRHPLFHLLLAGLVILAVFTHLLVAFPLLYLTLFDQFRQRRYDRKSFASLALLLSLVALKYYQSTHTGFYDMAKLETVQNTSLRDLPSVFSRPIFSNLLWRLVSEYGLAAAIGLAGLGAALYRRQWWIVLLTLGSFLAYLLAYCLVFNDFVRFYSESELMPLGIILAAPFVYYFLPLLREKRAAFLLAIISLTGLVRIAAAAPAFIARREFIEQTLAQMRAQGITKGLVVETEAIRNTMILHWASPEESAVASAWTGDTRTLSFLVVPAADTSRYQELPAQAFLTTVSDTTDARRYPRTYFRIDTAAPYRVVRP